MGAVKVIINKELKVAFNTLLIYIIIDIHRIHGFPLCNGIRLLVLREKHLFKRTSLSK